MGRVQHAKIFDEQVTQYLDSVFGDLQPSLPFFPGGPSVFMSRWSRLLAALQIPMHIPFTPAGLRAGGTVELYRRGTPILDIVWSLRLNNVETLQHYLQEISIQVTMVDMPFQEKNLSNLCPFYFPILLPFLASVRAANRCWSFA
jgi:hypothetical protein